MTTFRHRTEKERHCKTQGQQKKDTRITRHKDIRRRTQELQDTRTAEEGHENCKTQG